MAKRPSMNSEQTPAVLTIDAGTSALKAALYSHRGQMLALAVQRYGYRTPRPGWAEADPADWWQALVAALKELRDQGYALASVRALGITGQMHSPVLLDETGQVLSPAILWLDGRAADELRTLQAQLQLPPHQLNASFTLPKLLWLHRHRPEIITRTHTLLWPKDYLRFRLTRQRLTDLTDAAGAALLDWERRTWAVERLALVGLTPDALPAIKPSHADAGALAPEMAAHLGLSPDVRVIVGAGDVISLLGVAPMQPGRMICTLGSSTMLATPVPHAFQEDPQHRLHLYPFLPIPILNGIQSTSGAALTWAWHSLHPEQASLETTVAAALQTPPAAEGLLFLPFLAGERNPYWNDALRGAFFGLSLAHGRDHMMRAVMEGVALSVRHLLDIAASLRAPVAELALTGGGAAIPGWAQIFADVCQRPTALYASESAATRVIFAFCLMAISPQTSFDEALAAALSPPQAHFIPQPATRDLYDRAYCRYLKLADFATQLSEL
jgi:xylulokinase